MAKTKDHFPQLMRIPLATKRPFYPKHSPTFPRDKDRVTHIKDDDISINLLNPDTLYRLNLTRFIEFFLITPLKKPDITFLVITFCGDTLNFVPNFPTYKQRIKQSVLKWERLNCIFTPQF